MYQQTTSVISIDDTLAEQGIRSADIAVPGKEKQKLTYESYDGPLSINAGDDAFLLASLLMLMEAGHNVHIHGRITSKLLVNLDELQTAWARWEPSKYKIIGITADTILTTTQTDGPAISAFSGGVDASHTVFDVVNNRPLIDLKACLFVHGFDIAVDNHLDYASARSRGEKMLADFNLDSIGLKTNFKSLPQSWGDSFGLAVASCLALFQDKYTVGLIGSSEPYDELILPWGSNPVTDHLYSTGMMDMRHYGAGASRTDKMKDLLDWPAALQYLRVCWQGERGDLNCGRCEKCIRTYLNFKAVGASKLDCFECIPGRSAVRNMHVASRPQLNELKSIVKYAERAGMHESWLTDLRVAIAINSVRVPARQNEFLFRLVSRIKKARKSSSNNSGSTNVLI